jgi:hypothetical protein
MTSNHPDLPSPSAPSFSKPHSKDSSLPPGRDNGSSCPLPERDTQIASSSSPSLLDQNVLNADLFEILKGFTSSSNGCDDDDNDTMNAELLAMVQGFTALRNPSRTAPPLSSTSSPSSPSSSSSDGVTSYSKPLEIKLQSLLGYCGIEQIENLPPIWSELHHPLPPPPPPLQDNNPLLSSCSGIRRTLLLLVRHFARARKQDSRIQFFPKLQVAHDIQEQQFWHVGFDVDSLRLGITPFAFVQPNNQNNNNRHNSGRAESALSIATGDFFMSILATYSAAIRILFGTHCPLYAPLKEVLECFSTHIEAVRAVGTAYPEWYTKAVLLICQESRTFFMVERRPGATRTKRTSILQATDFLKLCITTTGPNVIPNSLELLPTLQMGGGSGAAAATTALTNEATTDENIALSKKRGTQAARIDDVDSQPPKQWKADADDEVLEDCPMEDAPSSSSSSSLQPSSTTMDSLQGETLNTAATTTASNDTSKKRQALLPRRISKRSKTTKEEETNSKKRQFTESPPPIQNSKRPRNLYYMNFDDPDL